MVKRIRRLLPWAALLGIAIGVRLQIIFALGTLWFDEAFSRRFALMPLGRMLGLLKYDVHPPFHAILLHYWLAAFGDDVRWMRVMSLLAAAAGLGLFALLGRALVGKRAGYLAFVLGCLSPVMAYYGADGRMYALVFLLAVASSWFFWKFVEGDADARIPWFGCAFALALTHVTGMLVLLAQALFLLRTPERRPLFRRLVPGLALISLAFAAWAAPAALHRLGTVGGEWQFAGAAEGSGAAQALVYWVWLGKSQAARAAVFAFVALAMVAGVMRRSERRPFFRLNPESEYLALWLACCFLPFLVLPTMTPRYLAAAVPALYLLLAQGFLKAGADRRAVLALGVAAVVLVSLTGLAVQMAARPYNWDKAVDWVAERYRPGDRVVFTWFADRNAWDATAAKPFLRDPAAFDVRALYPFDDGLSEDERIVAHAGTLTMGQADLDRLDNLMNGAVRVFLVPNPSWRLAGGGDAPAALNAWLLSRGWFLADSLAPDGRTQGVWMMVRK